MSPSKKKADFTYLIKLRIMNTYFWNSKKRHMNLLFVVLLDKKQNRPLRGRFLVDFFLPMKKNEFLGGSFDVLHY